MAKPRPLAGVGQGWLYRIEHARIDQSAAHRGRTMGASCVAALSLHLASALGPVYTLHVDAAAAAPPATVNQSITFEHPISHIAYVVCSLTSLGILTPSKNVVPVRFANTILPAVEIQIQGRHKPSRSRRLRSQEMPQDRGQDIQSN